MIEHLHLTQQYISLIKAATLENGGLDPSTIEQLQNPPEGPVDISEPDTRLSTDLFLTTTNASEATYNAVQTVISACFPDTNVLSHHLMKKLVLQLSGVVSIVDDMCVNSCHAFTGPFTDLDHCSVCGKAQYELIELEMHNKKIPCQQFHTIPLGPQLQVLRQSSSGSREMNYHAQKTHDVLAAYAGTEDPLDFVYDDIFCGSEYVDLIECTQLSDYDALVSMSLDGCQLYKNKASDVWIYIWIIDELLPGVRYKQRHVCPGGFISGPNKPKIVNSFLFREVHHNNGCGMRIWDSLEDTTAYSHPVVMMATADAIGIVEIDGQVGHHGAYACRLQCEMKGHHKPNSGHYFAAHTRLIDHGPGCNHPDTDKYQEDIKDLLTSQSTADKPTLLSGLDPGLMFPPPHCFLNIPKLLIDLWRRSIKCEPTDNKQTWAWMKLVGPTWVSHGKLIAEKKINSGYKATEWFQYLFGLGPAHFRHFCKLVHTSITGQQIRDAHYHLVQLYYQGHRDRLHFCQPCIHTLLHLAPETQRRTIGDLGREVRQPSKPFANLAQRGVRPMCPELNTMANEDLVQGTIDIGNGYVLLCTRDQYRYTLVGVPKATIQTATGATTIKWWARLQLPNGQIAHSAWKEKQKAPGKVRISRMVQHNARTFALLSIFSPPDDYIRQESFSTLWVCSYMGDSNLHVIDVGIITAVVSMQPFPVRVEEVDRGRWFVVEKAGLDDGDLVNHSNHSLEII
ncbi:hypothetical protein BDN71DRAFT_1542881 [Pleurotus eryngii]|uniref:Uncharacterized protein n=1 Tax=Pleurotus eryngii TaxID=5323 RepID=A0A9P5ZHG5_PLEER|nr:hypothetical protein BDN71DRAFT_1542881 [Pleurotus eryngii]